MMSYGFHDAEIEQRFARDGYVVVPMLTPEEVAVARAWAAEIMPPDVQINDPQGALYSTIFDEGGSINLPPTLDAIVTQRLTSLLDGQRVVGGCLIAKLAGSDRLDIHQHQPLTPDIYAPVVLCWIPLSNVDEGTGAIRVIPGSHRVLRHVQSFSNPPYFTAFREALETRHAITLPMQAGQALLFENSLLHGSSDTRATQHHQVRLLATAIPEHQPFCILTGDAPDISAWKAEGKEFDPGLFCMAGGAMDELEEAGRVDCRNDILTEAEFVELLRCGEKIAPGHDPIDDVRARLRKPMLARSWERVRAMVRSTLAA